MKSLTSLSTVRRMVLTLVVPLAVHGLHAQGLALQLPVTAPPFLLGSVMPTNDGGLLVYHATGPTGPLIRYNADGTVAWAKRYAPTLGADGHTPMPDGGVVISGAVDYYLGDTARYSNMRIGADGEAFWWRRYTISGWPVQIGQAQLTGAAIIGHDEESNVFTVLEHTIGAVSGPTVLKCDASGGLQWAVDLKEPPSMTRPVVLADEQGGCYVAVLRRNYLGNGFTLYRLNADGTLAWRRKLEADAQLSGFSGGITLSTDGTVLVAGWINNDAFHLRIDQDGDLVQALSFPVGQPTVPGNTKLPALLMPDGRFRFGERSVLTFSADGTLEEYRQCPTITYVDGNEDFELMHHVSGGDAAGLVVVGYLRARDITTNDFRMGMVAARIPWTSIGDGCPFECQDLPTAAGVPLSNEVFTYGEEAYEGPYPLYAYTSTHAVIVNEASAPVTTDACLTLTTNASLPPSPTLRLWPNPAAAGDILTIHVDAPRSWQCLDALGRTVAIQAQRTASGLLIPTAHLESGHYTILIASEGHTAPAVARFVVY